MNAQELTGQARSHIAEVPEPRCAVHCHAVAAFLRLRAAARVEGMDLTPVSSFRDFARQLDIWNGKFSGARPLLDAAGAALDPAQLSPPERVDAILMWSALPGASRHHWGTDLDLIDRAAVPPAYRPGLTPAEFAPTGPFAKVSEWLESNASRFGFFRPFRGILSGVRPEPWHFSFAPTAELARRRLTPGVLREALMSANMLGKATVLTRLEELHARYVDAIDWP